jgi:short-subunit dehydrogenase
VPYFAAYSASKAYVTNLSIALTHELRDKGVTVTAVHPPAVATSFSEAGKADIGSTLVLKLFGPLGPSPLAVARKAFRAAGRGRASVNIGLLAGAIYRSGFILPSTLDLPIMAMLFRHRGRKPTNAATTVAPSVHSKAA